MSNLICPFSQSVQVILGDLNYRLNLTYEEIIGNLLMIKSFPRMH
jgi:hypothetical protein